VAASKSLDIVTSVRLPRPSCSCAESDIMTGRQVDSDLLKRKPLDYQQLPPGTLLAPWLASTPLQHFAAGCPKCTGQWLRHLATFSSVGPVADAPFTPCAASIDPASRCATTGLLSGCSVLQCVTHQGLGFTGNSKLVHNPASRCATTSLPAGCCSAHDTPGIRAWRSFRNSYRPRHWLRQHQLAQSYYTLTICFFALSAGCLGAKHLQHCHAGLKPRPTPPTAHDGVRGPSSRDVGATPLHLGRHLANPLTCRRWCRCRRSPRGARPSCAGPPAIMRS
jgi:hypothetical protein